MIRIIVHCGKQRTSSVLLAVKRNIINPAGWLIAALQGNYLHSEYAIKEDDNGSILKTEEGETENKTVKSNKISFKEKPKGEINRLSQEEELEWIRKIRKEISK